jgi:hypothetical protein
VYGATGDVDRLSGRRPPGPLAWQNTAADIDGLSHAPAASGVFPPERRKPAIWPDIDPGIAFLGGSGISRRTLCLASHVAAIRGTAAHDELIAAGILSADDYWAYLAAYLGLQFVAGKDALAMSPAARIVPSEALRRADRLMVTGIGDGNAEPLVLLAPAGAALVRLLDKLEHTPQIAHRIRIATPETIRSVLLRRHAGHYADCAVQRLRRASAASSAFGRPGPVITSISAVIAGLFAAGLWMAPAMTVFAAAGLMNLIFLNSVLWKLAAALHRQPSQPAAALLESGLPAYTIMVPLYREANVVADLVRALAAIDYPRVKLQILLIVEADDHETVAAIERFGDARFELIRVPPAAPRTKPNALVFALPFARGDFIVVHDAEDRPEPGQLREAASAFAADPGLG